MSLKHGLEVNAPDDPAAVAAGKLTPSKWGSTDTDYATDPTHLFTDGATGAVLVRDETTVDGKSWIAAAAGVLAAAGPGELPGFRALVAEDLPSHNHAGETLGLDPQTGLTLTPTGVSIGSATHGGGLLWVDHGSPEAYVAAMKPGGVVQFLVGALSGTLAGLSASAADPHRPGLYLRGIRARGTPSAPAVVIAGDTSVILAGEVFNGTGRVPCGAVEFHVDEVSGSDISSYISMLVPTLTSQASSLERLRVGPLGLTVPSIAATALVPTQNSPRLMFRGHAWNTTAVAQTNYLDSKMEVRTTSGATPSSVLWWSFRRHTGNEATAFTDALSLSDSGILTLQGTGRIKGPTGATLQLGRGLDGLSGWGVDNNGHLAPFGSTGLYISLGQQQYLINGGQSIFDFRGVSFGSWTGLAGFGAIALGRSPSGFSSGTMAVIHGSQVIARNAANDNDLGIFRWGLAANDELQVGSASGNTRIRSNGAVPSTLANGDWWVECTGVSPSRVCAIKVRDGGATRTIASVTY